MFLENESDADVKVLNREVGRLEMSISEAEKTGLEPVVFLHYPPVYCNTECSEIMNVLLKHNNKKDAITDTFTANQICGMPLRVIIKV